MLSHVILFYFTIKPIKKERNLIIFLLFQINFTDKISPVCLPAYSEADEAFAHLTVSYNHSHLYTISTLKVLFC